MQIQTVTFSEAKEGNAPGEWQDAASGGVITDPAGYPVAARFIVLDGATTAYDPLRWVDQLVTSFTSPPGAGPGPGTGPRPGAGPGPGAAPEPGGPQLEAAEMRDWFVRMQERWAAEPRSFGSIIEERKFAEVGSFATLLGFEITGLDGPEPSWRAVALGDTVLFHVRDSRAIAVFPAMGPDDFGTLPDGVHTLPAKLGRMTERLRFGHGALRAGDFLFVATDAMAQWILRAITREETKVWDVLGSLAHPGVFARLVADQRREQDGAKRLKNDDVTLLRLRMLAGQPAFLLACR